MLDCLAYSFQKLDYKLYIVNKRKEPTCIGSSCFPAEFIRIENRERSTPPISIVASAKRIVADMVPSMTANTFSSCFLKMHRHKNSAQGNNFFQGFGFKDCQNNRPLLHTGVCACVCVQCLHIEIEYVHHNPSN